MYMYSIQICFTMRSLDDISLNDVSWPDCCRYTNRGTGAPLPSAHGCANMIHAGPLVAMLPSLCPLCTFSIVSPGYINSVGTHRPSDASSKGHIVQKQKFGDGLTLHSYKLSCSSFSWCSSCFCLYPDILQYLGISCFSLFLHMYKLHVLAIPSCFLPPHTCCPALG